MTIFIFAQTLKDLTENNVRQIIIKDLQRNTTEFIANHRHHIVKWLKKLRKDT